MTLFETFRTDCLSAQPETSDCRKHPLVYRRVFRLVAKSLPSYEADRLDGMSDKDARERLAFNVETQYRRQWRVDDDAPRPSGDGPYGIILITIGLVLGAIVVACIEWVVVRILDHWFPKDTQALACEAEQWTEPEYAD